MRGSRTKVLTIFGGNPFGENRGCFHSGLRDYCRHVAFLFSFSNVHQTNCQIWICHWYSRL